MVRQLIDITIKENEKLQEIKKYLRLNNINQVISYLIGYYAREMGELKKEDKE